IKALQGIIPKQIPVLAKAMGNVISNNLLSDNSINEAVVKNEENLKKGFIKNIENDDYRVLKTYLNENSSKIVTNLTVYIMKYLHENNSLLASKLTDEITKFDLSKLEVAVFTE